MPRLHYKNLTEKVYYINPTYWDTLTHTILALNFDQVHLTTTNVSKKPKMIGKQ